MNTSIQNILDALTNPAAVLEHTVDKLEYGDPQAVVKGVAVTFLATTEIIDKARSLGANLIVTHEGAFFSHWDKRDMLKGDATYEKKLQLIKESGMAIFRFHDYIHKYKPDGITAGLLEALNWKNLEIVNQPAASVVAIPQMTAIEVILHIKKCLEIQHVRFAGNLEMPCRRVGILVGYRGGGDNAIPLFEKENLDLLVCGEGPEWETPEYVRDSVYQGREKALIVLGHAESEVPGMKHLAKCLQQKFPDIPVHFIPSEPVFHTI